MHEAASENPLIVIGAGHAGGRAALTLRAEGYRGRLIMIGDEVHLPYERPPLSKGLLQGTADLTGYSLCDPQHLADADIEHIAGCPVSGLHPEEHRVTLADGRSLNYSKLLLATGGRARPLPGVTPGLGNVLYLRTHDEALGLRQMLQPGARLVIVGGGFIGLEVAASARALGCSVSVLEAGPRLAGRVLPPRLSTALLDLHRARGVEVRLDVAIEALEGTTVVTGVRLVDGSLLPCDLVLVGIGMLPNTQLAVAAGLDVGQGIRVDEQLRTSAVDVYAAGDVCEFRLQAEGPYQRQETWRNAESQARHAALNMLGAAQPFEALAGFWSDQYDWGLQTVGVLGNAEASASRELADGAFLLFQLDAEGRLQGVSGWGQGSQIARDIKLCERLILDGKPLSAASLADPAVSLKQLLRG